MEDIQIEWMSDEQKPIFYQYRTRPTTEDKYPWSAWRDCHESIYKYFLKVPVLNDWAYEVRALYTHPNPAVDEEISRLLDIIDDLNEQLREFHEQR